MDKWVSVKSGQWAYWLDMFSKRPYYLQIGVVAGKQ